MFKKVLGKIFGDRETRERKKYEPIIDEINSIYKTLSQLSDDELRIKIKEIKEDIQTALKEEEAELEKLREDYQLETDDRKKDNLSNQIDKLAAQLKKHRQEILDEYLPEVFAIVKDTCRRLLGYKYEVRGNETEWNMVPFDVQLMGGIVLHKGMIAEMATGEGKTLVATMPLFLNALLGRGVHLVTVNDYLAKRDSEWMAPIFEFHGLTVGCITTGMEPSERKAQYDCDITYGTNSEFGFDYLRDNMAVSMEHVVQRSHQYAIVDEVDSVLIDEARTPLIISGPVSESKNYYKEIKPLIQRIVAAQTALVKEYLSQVNAILKRDEPDTDTLGTLLLKIQRAAPKNKAFLKLMKDAQLKKLVSDYEGYYLRDKKMHVLDSDLYYAIEEKQNSVELTEKGIDIVSKQYPELYVLESFDEALAKIDNDDSLDFEEKLKQKEKITSEFMEKNEKLHNIKQLIRAYTMFEKDVDYVVVDNKVIIVDEFTGRMMPGRRFSDGLHQALEAKENVVIEEATQTFATITLQNYFRMYEKLAGMTGTAATEEQEFLEIYKLPVVVVPTNLPISRIDHDDKIYLTKNDKYQAIIREIEYWHNLNKPVLVGTVTVEVSEILSRMLKRRKIKHNVLNAKYHEKEAEIIKDAGQPGAVTIATNMAGRGTDIKLGEGVVTKPKEEYLKLKKEITSEYPYGRPLDGLHVIGTERHESRRIDRQLRGRSGRQGDPGTSRFYLSLEDDLMRLFGSERIAPMMMKLGLKEGEAIVHPWMSKTVERAQKRVESYNFEIRKQLIQYDEVMNQQREVIYTYRRNVLKGYDLKNEIIEMIKDALYDLAENLVNFDDYPENWNYKPLIGWLKTNINLKVTEEELTEGRLTKDNLILNLQEIVLEAYDRREQSMGAEAMRELERMSLLKTVDDLWREHLHEMDLLKEGIGLRAYAQKDPLIEYKKESFNLFQKLIADINKEVLQKVFTSYFFTPDNFENLEEILKQGHFEHNEISAFSKATTNLSTNSPEQEDIPKIQPRRVEKKIGRNDPCWCGSGKKYKNCHGKNTGKNE